MYIPSKPSAYRLIFLLIGVSLLLLNLVGLFTPLRNPGIYHEKNSAFVKDITLTEEQLMNALNSDTTDRPAYLTKATDSVSHGIAHYWLDAGIKKYNIRVPASENYLLYLAGIIHPKYFRRYEFVDRRRAIERGVGMCAQSACILADVLKEKGIPSRVVGLSGHVVSTAQVDPRHDKWWILDPDYGVVINHSIGEIEARPELIRPYYSAKGYSAQVIDSLVGYYGKAGNHVYTSAEDYGGGRGLIERVAYVLKWAIPACLILFAGIAPLLRHGSGSRQDRG